LRKGGRDFALAEALGLEKLLPAEDSRALVWCERIIVGGGVIDTPEWKRKLVMVIPNL